MASFRTSFLAWAVVAALWISGVPAAVDAQATPDPAALPEVVAPFGLGTVSLPVGDRGVLALFAALPPEVAGQLMQPVEHATDRIVAAWGQPDPMVGNPLRLTALHFPDGDFFPTDFTAGLYVATACAVDDVQATACGRDGDLVWLQAETTVGTGGERPGTPVASAPLYNLAWGAVDAPWLFTAAATTPEGLEALVTVFVTAASHVAATPAP